MRVGYGNGFVTDVSQVASAVSKQQREDLVQRDELSVIGNRCIGSTVIPMLQRREEPGAGRLGATCWRAAGPRLQVPTRARLFLGLRIFEIIGSPDDRQPSLA